MKTLFPLLMGILVICYGCSKDESQPPNPNPTGEDEPEEPTTENPEEQEPEMVTYFTFEALTNTGDTDDWVIIHDENGVLLDFKSFEFGDKFEFQVLEEEPQPNNFTITLFNYKNSIEGEMLHTIKSYPNISAESNWKHTPNAKANNEVQRGSPIGSVNITVNDAISPKYQFFSDTGGFIQSDYGPDFEGVTQNIFNENISIYQEQKLFYSFYDSNNQVKYYSIENVSDGDEIILDYSDFQSYDSYLEVDLPEDGAQHNLLAVVNTFEENQNISVSNGIHFYFIIDIVDSDSTDPLKLGYLDAYSKYHSVLSLNNNTYAYSLVKFGDKPNEISIPNDTAITVSDESISNYQFETNLGFQMKDILWEVKEGEIYVDLIQTTWNVFSAPDFSGTIGEIPEEIQSSYPNLRIDDLILTSTTLHLDFITYPDLLQVEFINPELKTYYKSHEYFRFKH
ncbi:hypothetical protein [Muricauda brasiliensis]|uniref:hypothetical protein n=1 Tax=Muricauda brasiliensis TaxID=2162892 RepID=UPI000D3530C9|nr:hypothetical protein [Muricauda brasiliensis]